ncbi:hypothetical protein M0R45_036376 [Rubus argutus]|uniref:MHC class I antigen n=1 Tax=Rubus argutus TaxID=59490 RepID=A0AAW1W011_RUBAR
MTPTVRVERRRRREKRWRLCSEIDAGGAGSSSTGWIDGKEHGLCEFSGGVVADWVNDGDRCIEEKRR